MPQVEIWAIPGYPLKESDWINSGFLNLSEYVLDQRNSHSNHMRQGCKWCQDISAQPLVSFGSFDPATGAKDVKKVCKTLDEMPTENIEGVLEFK